MPPIPPPSKTQQYDCKWYIPLTDLSFQTVDESEAAPSIPLVLDEELDAMKIKISQIKSDIQREKVRGQAGGEPGWLCSSGGSSTSQWASSAGPLTHCGSLGPARTPRALGAPGIPSDMELSRLGRRGRGFCLAVLVITAPVGSESQVGDMAPPEGLTCTRQTPGCFWRGAVF